MKINTVIVLMQVTINIIKGIILLYLFFADPTIINGQSFEHKQHEIRKGNKIIKKPNGIYILIANIFN